MLRKLLVLLLSFALVAIPAHAVVVGPTVFAGPTVKCDIRGTMFNVTTGDELSLAYVINPITAVEVIAYATGTSQSVTFNIKNLANRSGTAGSGNWFFLTDRTVTSSFGNFLAADLNPNTKTTSANRAIWIDVSAASGTVDEFHVTLCYTGGGPG